MSNKMYDILKWVAIIVLPAASTFVATVGPLWGMPMTDAVAQTITRWNISRCCSDGFYCAVQEGITDGIKRN